MIRRLAELVFWGSLSVGAISLGGLGAYEGYARFTKSVPSISERAAAAAMQHPHAAVGIAYVVGAAQGALAAHFGAWTPWGRIPRWLP